MKVSIHNADCLRILKGMPDCSVDSIVTDPPYGLSFMGKKWDYDVPTVEVWAECLRVLKPGGHLLAFAGTRTQHRMAVRIEDAGFEIRDMIAWVYGSGFPKSLDVSKAIDKAAGAEREVTGLHGGCGIKSGGGSKAMGIASGYAESAFTGLRKDTPATPEAQRWQGWGTALKPALEPITVARKPLCGTVAANVLEHGTGAINIDGCRVGTETITQRLATVEGGKAIGAKAVGLKQKATGETTTTIGRWPANFIHDGSDEVVGLFPDTAPARKADRGTALKPALEPITVARKPLIGTVAENVLQHGTGGLNVDGCRVGTEERYNGPASTVRIQTMGRPETAGSGWREDATGSIVSGRWPANLIHDGSDEVVGLFPDTAPARKADRGKGIDGPTFRHATGQESGVQGHNDNGGSAARFFYCAKSSKKDRGEGNNHPTVKPTDLMRYLCRLVTPPNGTVLDPYMGSGSTGKAAVLEGFSFIGIEMNAEYYAIARTRIKSAKGVK